MVYQGYFNKIMLAFTLLVLFVLCQPIQVYASGVLIVGDRGHYRHGAYTEIMVSGNRYYYNDGVYYTGSPGNYVVVEAPVGAIVYDEPASYEVVDIDGVRYYRHNNVYYRPHFGGGYEVVRMKERHDERDRHEEGEKHEQNHDR